MNLTDSIAVLPGVGRKRAAALSDLEIETIGDLLLHLPFRYEDRSHPVRVRDLAEGVPATLCGRIADCNVRRASGGNLHIATLDVFDDTGDVSVVLFGGARSFYRFSALPTHAPIALYGTPLRRSPTEALSFSNPDYLLSQEGDTDARAAWCRIQPVYHATQGISQKWLANLIYDCLRRDRCVIPDPLPEHIRSARALPTMRQALHGVHAPQSLEEAEACRRRLAYQELYDAQRKISMMREERNRRTAPALREGRALTARFCAALPFEMTRAQRDAIREIAAALDGTSPMYRLLQGDVGTGKTAVALAALAQCAGAGRQAAVLAPTTVLSAQFAAQCARYLEPLGVRCAELRGGTARRQRAALLAALAAGNVDVLVGTHALLEDDVAFRALGLIVIDEQHRFGVRQRASLAEKGAAPHILTMSATPIPRTLCMAVHGDVDRTELREKPASRKPVLTKLVSDNHTDDIYVFLDSTVRAGGRAFWVCPAVDGGMDGGERASVSARASDLAAARPGLRIERLFGAMPPEEKRAVVERFATGAADVLVATTVIEVGIDVPAANLLVVEEATRFGLSQLHQIRGRVGRGAERGVCILLDNAAALRGNARLATLCGCDDGFRIAEEDLATRGAGEIAGTRQHGATAFRAVAFPRDADLLEWAAADASPT